MDLPELPKETAGDQIHKVVRSALGAIPIVGTGVTELFNSIIIPPLTKKKEVFLEKILDELSQLSLKIEGFDIESLKTNDIFISTLTQALRITMHTHQQEKIELLKNAVINTTLDIFEEEDEYAYYLNILEDLSMKEFQALLLLEEYQEKTPRGFSPSKITSEGDIPDNDLQWVTRFWTNYEEALNKKLNISETEISGFIERLSRTGCFTLITGTYFGYLGGKGHLTDIYFKFKKFITLALI